MLSTHGGRGGTANRSQQPERNDKGRGDEGAGKGVELEYVFTLWSYRVLKSVKNKREMVRQWVDQGEAVRALLDDDGPNAVCRLMAGGLSLRALSRRAGLSATYLSRVKTGDCRISPTSYLALLKLEGK